MGFWFYSFREVQGVSGGIIFMWIFNGIVKDKREMELGRIGFDYQF